MILTLYEILDILVMTAALGIIFMGIFPRFKPTELEYYTKRRRFNWQDFKFAVYAAAPAVILHEFGHKFVAMGFGLSAVFNAAYIWLGIGLLLRFSGAGIIFFVPAYVSISNPAGAAIKPWALSITAFAGPAVNLIIWIAAVIVLRKQLVPQKYVPLVYITKQINMFLFIFNMIPIPAFDGYQVFLGLIRTIF